MSANDVTPPSAQGDDDRVGRPGSDPLPSLPGTNRKITVDQLEHALQHVTDTLLNTVTQGEAKAAAELVRNSIPAIVDSMWAAIHYRRLGHQFIAGEPHYLQITSWVHKDIADVASAVAEKVRL